MLGVLGTGTSFPSASSAAVCDNALQRMHSSASMGCYLAASPAGRNAEKMPIHAACAAPCCEDLFEGFLRQESRSGDTSTTTEASSTTYPAIAIPEVSAAESLQPKGQCPHSAVPSLGRSRSTPGLQGGDESSSVSSSSNYEFLALLAGP